MLRWLHEAFIDGGGDEGGVAAEKSKDGGGGTGRDEGKNYAGKNGEGGVGGDADHAAAFRVGDTKIVLVETGGGAGQLRAAPLANV